MEEDFEEDLEAATALASVSTGQTISTDSEATTGSVSIGQTTLTDSEATTASVSIDKTNSKDRSDNKLLMAEL